MSEVDNFFETELDTLRLESVEAVRSAAENLQAKLQDEFRTKTGWQAQSLARGIKVYHFDNASYVRLNPVLSGQAQRVIIRGNPNLWLLLPDGERLGFKRIGSNNSSLGARSLADGTSAGSHRWRDLKAKYGSRIFFHNDLVIFRHQSGRNYSIYKLQKQVETKPRINLQKLAEEAIN